MTAYLHIPDEIVQDVVGYFDLVPIIEHNLGDWQLHIKYRKYRKILLNLCLVSSQFRRCAQPILQGAIWDSGNRVNTWSLARNLAQDPTRAARCRVVSINTGYFDYPKRPPGAGTMLDAYPELAAQADLVEVKPGQWRTALESPGRYYAELGFLLSNMSQLAAGGSAHTFVAMERTGNDLGATALQSTVVPGYSEN